MFRKHKAVDVIDSGLLVNIKRDIENRLNEKGVMISSINMEMNPKNIALCIQLRYFPPKTHQLL